VPSDSLRQLHVRRAKPRTVGQLDDAGVLPGLIGQRDQRVDRPCRLEKRIFENEPWHADHEKEDDR
jgi:hypothetical protein